MTLPCGDHYISDNFNVQNARRFVSLCTFFSFLFLVARNCTSFGWLLMWCNASVWFVLGMLVKGIEEKYARSYSKQKCIGLCLLLVVISAFAPLFNGNVSIFSSVTNNFVLYLIFGFVGTIMVGVLCRSLISHNVVLEYLGIYSIIILAIHEPIKRFLMKAMMMGGDKVGYVITKKSFSENLLLGILLCLMVLVCCVPIISIFRKARIHFGKIGSLFFEFVK